MKQNQRYLIHIIIFLLSVAAVLFTFHYPLRDDTSVIIGSAVIISSFYLVLYLFLKRFWKEFSGQISKIIFLILFILFYVLLVRIILLIPGVSIYIIPFAIIPMVVRSFFNANISLMVLLITVMLCSLIAPDPFEFFILTLIPGTIAAIITYGKYRKGKYFSSTVIVIVTYFILFTGSHLAKGNSIETIDLVQFEWFVGNGILMLLSYPAIFLFERKFYSLSDGTLLELSDTSSPLLRRLIDEAPGSFQHSLQVANLAEEAAIKVNANSLLARVGAMYHDIGKIVNSDYFIENQSERISPHDKIDTMSSARMIIDHVDIGIKLAEKYRLPEQIIDFIRTHHGISTAYYFYKRYLDENPGVQENKRAFAYPGPKPSSKETAIVMMADAVEAASRTLGSYSEYSIRELVERIIYLQEADGQFSESPLTFREVSEIKDAFVKRLLNIYHARVAYPERDPD